ncbi:hypothetical protein GCM10027321_25900 [Massilia terrae]|uniref:Glycine-rich domain-containing protein-like n=1 Tax=Massilia terrae TaxID=1811224 RepID=A0ABT2CZ66_9BURK|nr:hypothetical protein [Massilia terrae]MCS0659262.1 hypothetical protein [Massilia terrae]
MNSYGKCREIVELDLDPIKVKLMHKESGEGWTLEQANVVEAEYRRYLYLMKAFPDETFAPGTDVDTFWHYHILDTTKYALDCQEIFGYFVHHFPYIGLRGEEDMLAHERLGQRMRTIYEAAFGETCPGGRLVSAPKTGGAYAAKAEGIAFSASPVGVRTAAGNDIAFSAAPGSRHASASSDIAFSAAPGGKRASASSDIAFSAAPGSGQASASSDIAFSAAPGGRHASASSDIAFSAAPGSKRLAAGSDIALSAAPGGKRAAASRDIAFSASPAGKRADISTGMSIPAASSGPVYMTRFGPAAQAETDPADADSAARPGDTASSDRLGNADGERVASDDLFSIRPRLPEPIAA